MDIDDLEGVSGGATIRAKRQIFKDVVNYTCPQCGSEDIEGIEDGAMFESSKEAIQAITRKMVRCRNCGYENLGGKMKVRVWLER